MNIDQRQRVELELLGGAHIVNLAGLLRGERWWSHPCQGDGCLTEIVQSAPFDEYSATSMLCSRCLELWRAQTRRIAEERSAMPARAAAVAAKAEAYRRVFDFAEPESEPEAAANADAAASESLPEQLLSPLLAASLLGLSAGVLLGRLVRRAAKALR